jgi:predicted ATPase
MERIEASLNQLERPGWKEHAWDPDSLPAKSLELRAVTALAELWLDQGKSPDAHALLAPVYGWFTEGFQTRDLIAARSLLDKLIPG